MLLNKTNGFAKEQKQCKGYEMVINERDILGTQFIKRQEAGGQSSKKLILLDLFLNIVIHWSNFWDL